MTGKKDDKSFLDSFFDTADRIVDGAAKVLEDVPDPDGEEEVIPVRRERTERAVIDVPSESEPLLKSGEGKKKPREVLLAFRNISLRRDGNVVIIAEMETHEVVAVVVSTEDYKKMVDAADWLE